MKRFICAVIKSVQLEYVASEVVLSRPCFSWNACADDQVSNPYFAWPQWSFRVHQSSEPDGMSAPEVVPVNSSAVRVLWSPPLQPNGVITAYRVYIDDRLHVSLDNSSGSFLLGNLLPFTIYNIQVHTPTYRKCSVGCFLMSVCSISGGGVHRLCMCAE